MSVEGILQIPICRGQHFCTAITSLCKVWWKSKELSMNPLKGATNQATSSQENLWKRCSSMFILRPTKSTKRTSRELWRDKKIKGEANWSTSYIPVSASCSWLHWSYFLRTFVRILYEEVMLMSAKGIQPGFSAWWGDVIMFDKRDGLMF